MNLALGTAQFGLDYGVSNTQGKVYSEEVNKILTLAKQHKISTLDTAPSYGDCEEVLGKSELTSQFNIVSKIPALKENEVNIEPYVESSLQYLKVDKLSAVLFHHVDDVINSTHAKKRFDSLLKLKEQGKVTKVGVSVYSPKQLEFCIKHYSIDIVQLPLNIMDQRFINSGWLNELADKNIEIHCRSIFLQGLLLMPQEQLPTYFTPFKESFKYFADTAKQLKVSPLSLALAIGHQYNAISKVLVGCCSTKQLTEIIDANIKAAEIKEDLSSFACENEQLIIPSNWN
jgi:aryl-alcohol dehydrogenase-like predicted oxidoreductase